MNIVLMNFILSLTVSVSSSNGFYHAEVRYRGGSELFTESLTLYDRYSKVIYTKDNIATNTFFICDNGNVFALNERYLCFFHLDGSEIMLKDLAYPNGFGFSPDNSVFFASDREGLFAYSEEGKLVGTYRPGRLFASTGKAGSVAIISADTLFVYENGGLTDTEFLYSPYARDVYFSRDARSILVEMPGNLEVYDTHDRTWVKQR